LSKPALLLLDKEPKSRRVLEVNLRKAGYEVFVAASGAEAWDRFSQAPPELVIADLSQDSAESLQLLGRAREELGPRVPPFLFISRDDQVEDKKRALDAGASELVDRPIYVKELLTRVKLLLQRSARAKMEGSSERTAFSGSLAELGVIDLLQSLEAGRKTGVVSIESDGRKGEIFVRQGRVIDAQLGRLHGEDAVYRMFLWSEGVYSGEFRNLRRDEKITLSPQGLVLEGLRRLEEWTRLLDGLPPVHHVCEVDYSALADRLGDLPDEVNAVLRLFDGHRSLLQVIDDAEFGPIETLTVLGKLYAEGILYDTVQRPARVRGVLPSPELERWLSGLPSLVLEAPAEGKKAENALPAPPEPPPAPQAPGTPEPPPAPVAPQVSAAPVVEASHLAPTYAPSPNPERDPAVEARRPGPSPSQPIRPVDARSGENVAVTVPAASPSGEHPATPAPTTTNSGEHKAATPASSPSGERKAAPAPTASNFQGTLAPVSVEPIALASLPERKAAPEDYRHEHADAARDNLRDPEPPAHAEDYRHEQANEEGDEVIPFQVKSSRALYYAGGTLGAAALLFYVVPTVFSGPETPRPVAPATEPTPSPEPRAEPILASIPAPASSSAPTSIPASSAPNQPATAPVLSPEDAKKYESALAKGADLFRAEKLDEAIAAYQEALTLDPSGKMAMVGIGTMLFEKGANAYDQSNTTEAATIIDDAIVRLETAVKVHPDFPRAYYSLAVAYEFRGNRDKLTKDRAGDRTKARAGYEAYLKLDPSGAYAEDSALALEDLSKP
jgi:CheY-like chemotaxis protein/tetratricopeptide (TPR) repeat protein